MAVHVATVLPPQRVPVRILRRPWDPSLRAVEEGLSGIPVRHGPEAVTYSHHRAAGCQRALPAGELPMGRPIRAGKEQAHHTATDTERGNTYHPAVGGAAGCAYGNSEFPAPERLVRRANPDRTCQVELLPTYCVRSDSASNRMGTRAGCWGHDHSHTTEPRMDSRGCSTGTGLFSKKILFRLVAPIFLALVVSGCALSTSAWSGDARKCEHADERAHGNGYWSVSCREGKGVIVWSTWVY